MGLCLKQKQAPLLATLVEELDNDDDEKVFEDICSIIRYVCDYVPKNLKRMRSWQRKNEDLHKALQTGISKLIEKSCDSKKSIKVRQNSVRALSGLFYVVQELNISIQEFIEKIMKFCDRESGAGAEASL